MEKLISFDLRADFGFFKKPDVNDGLQLSYNMLHKPALLGILGAIAGLRGYEEKGRFPEYYERLAGLLVGIEPLEGFHERGNFTRTVITYTNTVGYANLDGNLIVHEHTLVRPAYRCYLCLSPSNDEAHRKLYESIFSGHSHYVPYLGKNEFHAWWEPGAVVEYEWEPFTPERDFRVNSLFVRRYPLKDHRKKQDFDVFSLTKENESSFAYFERLPLYFRDEPGFIQYELAEFAYSDWMFGPASEIEGLFRVSNMERSLDSIIQLF